MSFETYQQMDKEVYIPHHRVTAVDLHYLASATLAGTVILLKEAEWKKADLPFLLGSLDEDFLPYVDFDHGNLNYTVVIGEVLEKYAAEPDTKRSAIL
jgi:hypothetical protein